MKYFAFFIATLFFASAATAQEGELVYSDNYHLSDGSHGESFHGNANPYSIDDAGLITGKHLSFFESGEVETAGMYRKGVKHGSWNRYSENGTLISEGWFNEGKKDGHWKVWDERGTLRVEMHYKNGNRVKTWKIYGEDGSLSEEKNYGK